MIVETFKTACYSFNPLQYKSLADRETKEMLKTVYKVFQMGFFIMLLLELPFFLSLPFNLAKEIGYFDKLEISGEVVRNSEMKIPENNPQIVMDFREGRKYADEPILVTKDYLFFKTPINAQKVRTDFLLKPSEYKVEAGMLITGLTFLVIPSIFLIAYVMFLLKYIVFLFVFSILTTIIIRGVFLSRTPIHKLFNMAAVALMPVMIIELLSVPFGGAYLIPIYDFLGMSFNIGTLIVYMLLLSTGAFLAEKEIAIEVKDRRYN